MDERADPYQLEAEQLAGQVILLTGASGALGGALAVAMADAGATVVLNGRDESRLDALYDHIEQRNGPQPALLPFDLNRLDAESAINLIDTVTSACGRLDGIVHAAAHGTRPGLLEQHRERDWQSSFRVNLDALQWLCAASLPMLRQSRLGSIVALLDQRAGSYRGGYRLSKAALAGWVQMQAEECAGALDADGAPQVAVNGVDPGPMRSQLRRNSHPGEGETESPPPASRMGPVLMLLSRQDRFTNGTCLQAP